MLFVFRLDVHDAVNQILCQDLFKPCEIESQVAVEVQSQLVSELSW